MIIQQTNPFYKINQHLIYVQLALFYDSERAEVIAWYDLREAKKQYNPQDGEKRNSTFSKIEDSGIIWVAIGLKNRNKWTIVPQEYLTREADLIPDYGKINVVTIGAHYAVWIPYLIATFPFGMVAIAQKLRRRRGEVKFARRSCRIECLGCCLKIDNIIWYLTIF